VGAKVYRTLPNSYAAVSAAVNQGMPLAAFAHRDPVTKVLEAMATELLDRPEGKKTSWLGGLLHHH
jgi:pilus assembly protein CpaE